jgi:diadenosine tetraphosphate (Ap4A) HIT family hydrolase
VAKWKIEIVLDEHNDKEGEAYDGFNVTMNAYDEGGQIHLTSGTHYMGLYSGKPNFEEHIGAAVTKFVKEISYPQIAFD